MGYWANHGTNPYDRWGPDRWPASTDQWPVSNGGVSAELARRIDEVLAADESNPERSAAARRRLRGFEERGGGTAWVR